MKQFQDILTTDISRFNVEEWDKKELFYNYDRLKSYVSGNFDAEHFDFLMRPYRKGMHRNEIVWQSNLFDEQPVPLSSLSGSKYAQYKALLDDKLSVFRDMVQQIEQASKNREWAKLLGKAILYGGDDYVYCGDGKVALAAWSMLPKPVRPEQDAPPQPSRDNDGDSRNNEENRNTQPSGSPSVLPESESDVNEGSDAGNTSSPAVENNLFQPSGGDITQPSGEQPFLPETENSDNDNTGTNQLNNNDGNDNNITPENAGNQSQETPPSPVTGSGNEKKWWQPWWKWLLWLLLLLLLLLLVGRCVKSCSGDKIPNIPKEPGILEPVNPDDIGFDRDSIAKVVTNRLNILLETQNLNGFMVDFQQTYPDCRIIYYDDVTLRLQIEVPKDEKQRIREELPLKLPEYDFIVFDEQLFEGNYRPDDPAMNDPRESWYLETVKAIGAWDKTRGSDEIVVAVVDGGFDLMHPELKDRVYMPYNVWTKSSQMFFNGKGTIHGTHVAGTALAQSDNRTGLSGIAPLCRFMPVQVADMNMTMTTMSIMDGILYAVYKGADVINVSLGMSLENSSVIFMPEYMQQNIIDNNFKEEERVWNKVYEIAEKHNTAIVYAAGNENILAAIDPGKRNGYCIMVSAVDPNISKASFSNYGNMSTVSAPGVRIYSSTPGNAYGFLDGTSMAAPIVTGGVALIKSVNKTIPTRDIIRLLQETGIPVHSMQRVGNLIQLDRAIDALVAGPLPVADNCDVICRRIDSLQREIDRLKQQCPQYSGDTLKLPDVIENPASLAGLWRSTTSLRNTSNREVVIYFEFDGNGSGKIILQEPDGTLCTASLTTTVSGADMQIVQDDDALCENGTFYNKYIFSCKADKHGYAECVATNTTDSRNVVRFRLIKVR
jgi:subtilisin family serine protease